MDDKQPDMKFPQSFMNHLKSDSMGDVFNHDASKQKTSSYPSVDGLPKYSQTNQLQFMVKNVIKSMMSHKHATPFLKPVDKKIYKDYYDVINRPIDLGFIKKKLTGKHYQSASDCIADFKQMFENCDTYNRDKEDPEILKMNEELKKYFFSKIAKLPVKEQPLTLKGKTTKKNPRTSFSGSVNGSNYDGENSDDDDDIISHKSGIGTDERTNSPSAFNFDPQDRRTEESLDSESRKFLKRKANVLGSASPNKNKGGFGRQVPKRSAKEFKLPENAGHDIDIGDFPANSSVELRFCFDILREFYKRPLSARTSRYYQLENKSSGDDTDEDVTARKQLFMDLNTVLKKFKQSEYEEPEEFATDMRKIFTFIYRFSTNSPSLVKETQDIQNIFELRFAQVPFPRKRQQSIFNVKIDSLIKVVKNIGYQLENLKVKEPPLKRRRIANESNPVHNAGVTAPLPTQTDDRLQQKTKPKPRGPVGNSSHTHPLNKSPVNRCQPQPPLLPPPPPQQKQQTSSNKEIPREYAMFLRPASKEQPMNQDEMLKLSYVLRGLQDDNLGFLLSLINYLEPVDDPQQEYVLDLEKLKPSSLRAIERYAVHCVGSEKYSQMKEHLDKKPLPLCAGQYKIPQPPSKTAVAPKSLHQHNKNSSIGFSRVGEANLSSSSSVSSSSNSSSSFVSSPEVSRQTASTAVANSTSAKPPSQQQISADQTKSLNGDGDRKQTPTNVRSAVQSTVAAKSSDSGRTPNKTMPPREPASKFPTEDEAKQECQNAKFSPEEMNKNLTPSMPAEKLATSEEKANQAKQQQQPIAKDSGAPVLKNNDHVAVIAEDKNDGSVKFPAWGSMLQKSKTSAPQLPIQNTNETFIIFKKQAEEREREKLSKQQEEERRHRMELENDERLKKEKEMKQAQEEEDALFGALGKTKPPEPQPGPSRVAPPVVPANSANSRPASPKNEGQQVLSPSERRLIEQQRRKNAARACQIDLNAQSEIFAAFERDLHGQSLMNH